MQSVGVPFSQVALECSPGFSPWPLRSEGGMLERTERWSPVVGTPLICGGGATGRVGSLFKVVTLYRTDRDMASTLSRWVLVGQF